ncbi:ferredoxin family protein [Streptomyces sp. NA04227]|uniref:4Fe-4S dicluster domain-containing protein n=1 Tax=Streptomyces sp. NA04227 TaxID=2742136 RepID=UPI0015906BDA|nr:ferredoxin family protein [Streptomyces sp. NA04227]QKW09069.1 ferredoxin family protein [Streptomyces sp. NA04227]
MIELVSADRCIACDKCIEVCPTNVFDRGEDGIPVLTRHDDCQTCFQCEANCPADALYVAPLTHPLPSDSTARDEEHLTLTNLLGSYRRHIGWGHGRTPGALKAIGPRLGPPGAGNSSPPLTS